MKLEDLFRRAQEELRHLPDFSLDASLIFMHVLHLSRVQLITKSDLAISEEDEKKILEMVKRRSKHEPIAYLLNRKYFMGLEFYVDPNVLIPRGDTELLCEKALKLLNDAKNGHPWERRDFGGQIKGLEIGVGSGAIAISLLYNMPCLQMDAMDISEKAVAITSKNASVHGVSERLQLICADALDSRFYTDLMEKGCQDLDFCRGIYDFIISNPPYINPNEKESLMEDVRNYEPHQALFAHEEGLAFYRCMIGESDKILKTGGFMIFEIGYDQGIQVKELMELQGFSDVEIIKDYEGHDRIVLGFKR